MVLTIRVVSIEAASESVMIVMMILTNYSKENQIFLFRILATFISSPCVRCDAHWEKYLWDIYDTLLHQPRKTKGGVKARIDLIEL